MKRENKIIKTFILLTLLTVAGCASAPKTESTNRGPASMQSQAPMAWGKSITPESEDFLEDVENAPARSY